MIEGYDGIDIMEKLIKDQQRSSLIKCIITDENMEYINGSEAIKSIRDLERNNKTKNVPIISLTAFEDEISRNNIMNSGSDHLLTKPCNKNELIKIFKELKLIWFI